MSEQFTVGHFWLLHLKNTPRLEAFADDSIEIINEKKAFYSGAMAALGFAKLSFDLRSDQQQSLVAEAVKKIMYGMPATDVPTLLEKLTLDATINLSDMAGKHDSLVEEVRHEIIRLKNTSPAAERPWWNRFFGKN